MDENKLSLSEWGLMDLYGNPEAQMSSLAHNKPPRLSMQFYHDGI